MSLSKHQRDVENRLKEALKADRARIQIGRISRFGLLEMSRQRLRLSLGESAQDTCPRCEGRGTVRNIQSHALSIVRIIEEEALKEKTSEIHVQLPAEMATFIMNEKRDFILKIEKRHNVHLIIIANPYLHIPQYKITRFKEDNVGKNRKPSYSMIQPPEMEVESCASHEKTVEEPAVKQFTEHHFSHHKEAGLIKKLWKNIFGQNAKSNVTERHTEHLKFQEKRANAAPKHHENRHSHHPSNRRRRPSGNNHQGHQHDKATSHGKGGAQHKNQASNKNNNGEGAKNPNANKKKPADNVQS